MKNLFYLGSLLLLLGCNTDSLGDCFQNDNGAIVRQEFEVDDFKKIIVFDRVKLFISQGPVQKVIVESPSNLLNEVKVRVEDSILKLKDNNSCNLLREFETTKVYVTSPNIEYIRNSSGSTIEDIDTLRFARLSLVSEDQLVEDEFHIDGDFNLDELAVGGLTINANGLSTFRLKGRAKGMTVGLSDGDVRVEAGEFKVKTIKFFHRSTNNIICHPIDTLQGRLVSLGDVICTNRASFVNVLELFNGKLICE